MPIALPTAQELRVLFGSDVETAGRPIDLQDSEPLFPDEEGAIENARPERIAEFRAGRHAARHAMAALGQPAQPVLRNADRSPAWPAGLVGSITHVRRGDFAWAGAAVARQQTVRSLGLDAESAEPLEAALFRRVLLPSELGRLDHLPDNRRGHMAKLVFSAKEAVYKCQHPLTRTFLEFSHVEIEVEDGCFGARILHPDVQGVLPDRLNGRYLVRDAFIITAVTLRRP